MMRSLAIPVYLCFLICPLALWRRSLDIMSPIGSVPTFFILVIVGFMLVFGFLFICVCFYLVFLIVGWLQIIIYLVLSWGL